MGNAVREGVKAYPRFILRARDWYELYGPSKTLRLLLYYHCQFVAGLCFPMAQEHCVETNGYKLITIPSDRGISKELVTCRTHEPVNTRLLKGILKEGSVCLDIGANIGYYALLERMIVGKKGRVIAIEPVPVNYGYLVRNLRLNGFDDVDVFDIALSDSDRTVEILLGSSSNLARVVQDGSVSADHVVKVKARSLDSLFRDNHLTRLDFMRIDVEGHEGHIYDGARQTVRRFKPIIAMELHLGLCDNAFGLLENLKSDGYNIKYCLPRELDLHLVGQMNDVCEPDISQLANTIANGRAVNREAVFSLVLEDHSKRTPHSTQPT